MGACCCGPPKYVRLPLGTALQTPLPPPPPSKLDFVFDTSLAAGTMEDIETWQRSTAMTNLSPKQFMNMVCMAKDFAMYQSVEMLSRPYPFETSPAQFQDDLVEPRLSIGQAAYCCGLFEQVQGGHENVSFEPLELDDPLSSFLYYIPFVAKHDIFPIFGVVKFGGEEKKKHHVQAQLDVYQFPVLRESDAPLHNELMQRKKNEIKRLVAKHQHVEESRVIVSTHHIKPPQAETRDQKLMTLLCSLLLWHMGDKRSLVLAFEHRIDDTVKKRIAKNLAALLAFAESACLVQSTDLYCMRYGREVPRDVTVSKDTLSRRDIEALVDRLKKNPHPFFICMAIRYMVALIPEEKESLRRIATQANYWSNPAFPDRCPVMNDRDIQAFCESALPKLTPPPWTARMSQKEREQQECHEILFRAVKGG